MLTAAAWPVSQQLRFDESIESLYAKDDPHLTAYLQSKRLFGGDEFIIVAYTDPELFTPDGRELTPEAVKRIETLAERLNQVPGIQPESTQHLASALKFPYGRERVKNLVEGVLLGDDQQTTAVVLRLKSEKRTPEQLAHTIAEIRRVAAGHEFPAYVVGEPVQVHDMFRYVKQDGRKLFAVSLALLAAVILALFRRLRWMFLPLGVVMASIIWTEAVLVLSRMQLSMVSSMLNSLVTIIGIATVTHVTVHFREHRKEHDRVEALKRTLVELAAPIFWTCMTTAAGFAALLSSQITPVQSFGTMMTLATLMVLVAAAGVLPGGVLLGGRSIDPYEAASEKRLQHFLSRVTEWVQRRPRMVSGLGVLIVVVALAGFFRLEVETDFSRNFRESSPIVRSLNFVETKLGGAGSWEVNFPAPPELSEEYLDEVTKLAERLRTEHSTPGDGGELTKVVSLTDGLSLVPRIPFVLNTLEKRVDVLDNFQGDFLSSVYNAEAGRMRLVLRARERQPSETKNDLIEDVRKTADEQFPGAQTTGLFVLLAFLIESLLRDQWVSFLLAGLGIGGLMTIAFRSVRIGLISLVPNLFPIVLVIGTMGWVGLPINIATAMIASVSMGLTVDSSIHYISGYRRTRQRGASIAAALRETHQGVGRALVFANVALIIGFSVLTLSHFIPLVYFGILVSVAMLGGLIGNLVLLPLLLQWVDRDAPETPRQPHFAETSVEHSVP